MQDGSDNQIHDAGQLDSALQTPTTSITVSKESNITSSPVTKEHHQQYSYQSGPSLQQVPSQATMAYQQQPQGQQGVSFDLASMNNTLPAINHRPQHPSQYIHNHAQSYSPTTSPPMAHQMAPIPPYGDPAMPMPNHSYYVQSQQMPHYYPTGNPPHGQSQGRQGMVYYPNQIIMNPSQQNFYYSHDAQFSGHLPAIPANVVTGAYMTGISKPDARNSARFAGGQYGQGPWLQNHETMNSNGEYGNRSDTSSAKQNTVRGPPRKPRQSGHALWIGNLPPQTDLMALVHHVCKETSGLESLFLISKSNCAFANYKDEAACSIAQQSLHDSKFQSVRLVSRLRKSTVEGTTGNMAPTGPAATILTQSPDHEDTDDDGSPVDDSETKAMVVPDEPSTKSASPTSRRDSQARQHVDKFFILKSLTTEDLDLSVQTGIWATQSHNENNLNTAFQAADNVYLIFSANKSGEYFGYARMVSEINEDPAAAIEFAPKVVATADVDLPKAIPTDATEFAPKGKIIDDSARGTIFWEAERDDSETGSDFDSENASDDKVDGSDEDTKVWGKPFKLEWLSTNRLPFFRTRGLRNPWNPNREVKIARDGTELEPSVGRRLIGLFNRVQSPTMVAVPVRGPMNFVPGYPPVRPYGQ